MHFFVLHLQILVLKLFKYRKIICNYDRYVIIKMCTYKFTYIDILKSRIICYERMRPCAYTYARANHSGKEGLLFGEVMNEFNS